METIEKEKRNPISRMRYRWQTYTKDTDQPIESEWEQLRNDAIKHGAMCLVKEFEKFGKDDIVVKIFNEMNRKHPPIVIDLDEAYKILNIVR